MNDIIKNSLNHIQIASLFKKGNTAIFRSIIRYEELINMASDTPIYVQENMKGLGVSSLNYSKAVLYLNFKNFKAFCMFFNTRNADLKDPVIKLKLMMLKDDTIDSFDKLITKYKLEK
jgi:phage regulator Rha-like protein